MAAAADIHFIRRSYTNLVLVSMESYIRGIKVSTALGKGFVN